VGVYQRNSKIDFGVLSYDEDRNITNFVEKPVYHFNVSMGVYCINRRVIEDLPKGEPYGFDNLMIDGIKDKNIIGVMPFDGYWLDLGRPEDFDTANENYDELKTRLALNE
jgi:NDP-sugar pyrophosphorylase family protein